jgi:hypothetical protein
MIGFGCVNFNDKKYLFIKMPLLIVVSKIVKWIEIQIIKLY